MTRANCSVAACPLLILEKASLATSRLLISLLASADISGKLDTDTMLLRAQLLHSVRRRDLKPTLFFTTNFRPDKEQLGHSRFSIKVFSELLSTRRYSGAAAISSKPIWIRLLTMSLFHVLE